MVHALVVDDDPQSIEALTHFVSKEGFSVSHAGSLAEAREEMDRNPPDLALIDLELPDGSGVELIEELTEGFETEVIMVTGHGSVDSAVEALKTGAVDYLTKPVDPPRLRKLLENFNRTLELRQEVLELRDELRKLGRFGKMVGRSQAMQKVYDLITKVAPTDSTVLIHGQTGTGKEVVAHTLHRLSKRAKNTFIPMNCGSIQETLIESELFGHERGSFTGADRTHKGYFERANGGTLFLDEVTEMPMELQSKLLRVLETGKFMRVGGNKEIPVDVRVIAATNRDPDQAVEKERLREDLYYRLMVFPIQLPPLKERLDDIPLLANFFLEALNRDLDEPKRFTSEALDRLKAHHWPGNVRELKNVVERAFIVSPDRIDPASIILTGEKSRRSGAQITVQVGMSVAEAEKALILATLEDLQGNKKTASEMLGISLKTLYSRLNKYGVTFPASRVGEKATAGSR